MLRKMLFRGNDAFYSNSFSLEFRSFCERRRRKGDGTKTDIFDERAAASQDEYFRKKTARQVEILKEKIRKEKEKQEEKEKTEDKPSNNNQS